MEKPKPIETPEPEPPLPDHVENPVYNQDSLDSLIDIEPRYNDL